MEPMSLWPEISSTDILAVEKLTRNEIDKGKITVVIPREGIGNNFPSKFPPFHKLSYAQLLKFEKLKERGMPHDQALNEVQKTKTAARLRDPDNNEVDKGLLYTIRGREDNIRARN